VGLEACRQNVIVLMLISNVSIRNARFRHPEAVCQGVIGVSDGKSLACYSHHCSCVTSEGRSSMQPYCRKTSRRLHILNGGPSPNRSHCSANLSDSGWHMSGRTLEGCIVCKSRLLLIKASVLSDTSKHGRRESVDSIVAGYVQNCSLTVNIHAEADQSS